MISFMYPWFSVVFFLIWILGMNFVGMTWVKCPRCKRGLIWADAPSNWKTFFTNKCEDCMDAEREEKVKIKEAEKKKNKGP
jgi:hypothetical protein